jgi:arsenate reductase (thioredoxin)
MPDSVLYVCLGNSCRSIMAEALTRHFFPDAVKAGSAGINPLGYIAEETLQVLAELGLATDGLRSKGLADINLGEFHLLVNLSTYSLHALLPRTFQGRIIHYPVTDPFGNSLEVYREVRDTLSRFVTKELPRYLTSLKPTCPLPRRA